MPPHIGHSPESFSINASSSCEEYEQLQSEAEAILNHASNWKEWIDLGKKQPFRVLVICHENSGGSNILDALKVCNVLITTVRNGAQALGEMRHTHFDIMFTGLRVLGMDILYLIRVAKNVSPDTEIFVLTSYETIALAIECIKKGAEGLVVGQDIEEQVAIAVKRTRCRRNLRLMACTDGLTALFNRDTFNQFLVQECYRSARRRYSFALLILDIDHFKEYNDLNGHLIGDVALIKLGRLLKQSTRASDIPARYGGDEFAVILTEITHSEALTQAERIWQLISSTPFQHEKNIPGKKLTVSIGLSLYPEHGSSFAEIIRSADQALYQAKAEGRNRVCVFQKRPKVKHS